MDNMTQDNPHLSVDPVEAEENVIRDEADDSAAGGGESKGNGGVQNNFYDAAGKVFPKRLSTTQRQQADKLVIIFPEAKNTPVEIDWIGKPGYEIPTSMLAWEAAKLQARNVYPNRTKSGENQMDPDEAADAVAGWFERLANEHKWGDGKATRRTKTHLLAESVLEVQNKEITDERIEAMKAWLLETKDGVTNQEMVEESKKPVFVKIMDLYKSKVKKPKKVVQVSDDFELPDMD